MTSYDIIGDIHGQATKLERLLSKLGYQRDGDSWAHPTRTAIFLGDFIDRGPEQVRTIKIARQMVRSGNALAVMGNHELNAIAWHTPDPTTDGEFLRPRTRLPWGPQNRKQHAAFLAEVEQDPDHHAELVDWFLSLPLWLELPGFCVVHACWHHRYISWLAPMLTADNCLRRELLPMATIGPSDLAEKDNDQPSVFKAVEALTKGIEIPLPQGFTFVDEDGIVRRRVRVRWWDSTATTYRTAALLTPAKLSDLPEAAIPDHARIDLNENKPVFFGHYWLTGKPAIQGRRAACVDYSAGKGGPLVAYRYDGEAELSEDKLMWVD